MSELSDELERQLAFRQNTQNDTNMVFSADKSAGRNPTKLAQILGAYDFAMTLLGWQKKPVARLSNILVNYQASIDAKYHDDFVKIRVAEEVEKRLASRRGVSIFTAKEK